MKEKERLMMVVLRIDKINKITDNCLLNFFLINAWGFKFHFLNSYYCKCMQLSDTYTH